MKKPSNSRPARWARACEDARAAYEKVEAAITELNEAREALDKVRAEYEEWRDNLPESLQNSALGEKLQAVADLDMSDEAEAPAVDWLDEAENADLPLGFGRD